MTAEQIRVVIFGFSNETGKEIKIGRHTQSTNKSIKEIMDDKGVKLDPLHTLLNGIQISRDDCFKPLSQVEEYIRQKGSNTIYIVTARAATNISPRQIKVVDEV